MFTVLESDVIGNLYYFCGDIFYDSQEMKSMSEIDICDKTNNEDIFGEEK